jgi:DNA-binding CsgD family transcriptional regulator
MSDFSPLACGELTRLPWIPRESRLEPLAVELVGRDGELTQLRELVSPSPAQRQVLMLLGEAGVGKTVLLDDVSRQAETAGWRVLSAVGQESEHDLPFAGLHQMLWPVLDRLQALPDRQAKALLGALALSAYPTPPDDLLTRIAVLTLLSELSAERPLLVVADNAQWLDQSSLGALAFAIRRLLAAPLVLLLGVRGTVPPAAFGRDFPELMLPPLSTPDAGRLLDGQPSPPRGRAREDVLAQAAGNPMALIELTRVVAADPDAGRRWAAEPPPLTGRLTAVMASQFSALPAPTRAALLLAAAADTSDLTAARVPGLTARTLAPAEAAGLISLDRPGPRFTHPLVRAAVYRTVPFAERAAAHLAIAEALRSQPDRHAWHLAAAALEPDERVALLLEQTTAQAQRRGGLPAAARALERAAELSPCQQDQARRLLAAAALAVPAGQADWVAELATRALSVTADPELHIVARLHVGWALTWSGRHVEALSTLISVAAQASVQRPAMGWKAAALAATVAYNSGSPPDRRAVLDAAGRLPGPARPSGADPADVQRVWIAACTDPFGNRDQVVPALRRLPGEADPVNVGAAAWLLDETELAVRLLRQSLDRLHAPGTSGCSGPALAALQWACMDSGRWPEALAAAREAADAAAAYKMDTVAASADLTVATMSALRGHYDQVRPLVARAFAAVDPADCRVIAARARHAAGLAALAEGSALAAYAQLSRLFDADGAPLHQHVSYLAIADLAAAAVNAERHLEVRALLDRVLALVDPAPGPRLTQLMARARGLLAEPAEAEQHFGQALSDPAGDAWPFERARLQLDYGKWLRRQRRINDAKPVLAAALERFRGLGATPWTQRAEAELRACGVTAQTAPAVPGVLAALTAQQREIVILASRGLTNGEIADRLYLSPRTVASHLYRSFPKLGISGRQQLRDLIDRAPPR